MRTFEVTLTGKTPLLMHWDNIEWADEMDAWKNDPDNKKFSKPGDDRTPAFRWLGSMYHDEEVIAVPSDNLMKCLMEGGAMVLVPGGKNGKTFKAQTQSGCISGELFWPLQLSGKTVPVSRLLSLREERDFSKHQATAAASGFSLFVKRVRVGAKKHIRVRPRFDGWSLRGTIHVIDDQVTPEVLSDVLRNAGQYKGLGDWRPSSRTPGSYGMFTAEIQER